MKPKRQTAADKRQFDARTRALIGSARGITSLKYSGLYNIKSALGAAELFSLFPQVIRSDIELEELHGGAFPRQLDAIFSKQRLGAPVSILNEIVWAIASSLIHAPRLADFSVLRAKLEKALLGNDLAECSRLLDEKQEKFGWSLWLVQNRLTITQMRDGIDEKRKLARAYEERVLSGDILSLMFGFISQRCEGTTVPGYLQGELNRLFPDSNAPALVAYLKTTLFDLANPEVGAMAATLSYASQTTAIDYYETLLALLQALSSDAAFPDELAEQLGKPLISLHRRVADPRLTPVLIALTNSDVDNIVANSGRSSLVEAYSEGRYQQALDMGERYVRDHPDDIAAFVVLLRAEIRAGTKPLQFNGVLGELADNLREVFALSARSYTAAYSLITLHERFFGHGWVTYARAVVMNELAQEESTFPPHGLRRQYAVDRFVTPFSCLLARDKRKEELMLNRLADWFPSTVQVYCLATCGKIRSGLKISDERKHRYLGRYFLHRGLFTQATEHYDWLRHTLREADAFRGAAGAALCYLALGDLKQSVEVSMEAYSRWPHVPTVLPITAIVGALDEPTTWPNTIAVPLTFELYSSFFGDDRMSHLRYSFERFQTDNEINSPTDVLKLRGEVGEAQIVHYLNRVWRPEVMSQTMLYESTKEINDSRIRVCKLLSEIDSDNSASYVGEIRERVKQQEIAKATSLVAQSKVYVDIGAIKKALRSRLGDAYARYKSAVSAMPIPDDKLVQTITDFISQVPGRDESLTKALSELHVLSSEGTNELDVQFASMFSEVTNEFLRGDHGLNAYLSTRVRHGKMSNALRKAVADEHLVTARKEGESGYVENHFWAEELSGIDEETRTAALNALQTFAAAFDSIVGFIRDKLIQIAVIHEFVDSGNYPHALLVYRSSNLERKFVQAYDRKIKVIDEFIDRCIETLWEKTDENLVRVQNVLNTKIRGEILEAFDQLVDSLAKAPNEALLRDLTNHVARARTNTQNGLATVSSWFKRSEVYDRQDYMPDFAVLVAANMVSSTISGVAGWEGARVVCELGSLSMPGRTLDGMVDIFEAVLENAIEHASVPVDDLVVNVEIKYIDGHFSATIENITGRDVLDEPTAQRLERLRDEIASSGSRSRAQVEGRSGFHKIWATINAPQYRDPALAFGFTSEGTFKVKFEFNIGSNDDEDATH